MKQVIKYIEYTVSHLTKSDLGCSLLLYMFVGWISALKQISCSAEIQSTNWLIDNITGLSTLLRLRPNSKPSFANLSGGPVIATAYGLQVLGGHLGYM